MLGRYWRGFSLLLKQATDTQELVPEPSKLPRAQVVSSPSELLPATSPATIRLTKRMSLAGICSRRQAERLITAGLIKVDGKRAEANLQVGEKSVIEVARNKEMKSTTVPIPDTSRMWAFYKPMGLITSHADPAGRPSVFDYLRKTKRFEDKHIISVGRLDFKSEGLLLLTNNGDVSQALERSSYTRLYRIRAYGKWTEAAIEKMRAGVTISGVSYRPMRVWMERKQTRNTWFKAELTEGKNREIRRIFERFGLRVNRLIRLKYGPYVLDGLKPGELREESIPQEVHKVVFNYYKKEATKTEMG